jgi:hypothetical protein
LAGCSGSGSSGADGGDSLLISPQVGLHSSGEEGGPFLPSTKTYTLTNPTAAPIAWAVASNQNWLSLPNGTSGTLAAGESTTVLVQIDAAQANLLAPGTHSATLHLDDGDDSTVDGDLDCTIDVNTFTADGWTTFAPSSDSLVVYVSASTGDDQNDGLSESTAKETISAGLALMRHGFPDWLLLRKGDTFPATDVPSGGYKWIASGRSPTEPQLFSSFGPLGTARPLIQTAGKPALRCSAGGDSPPVLEHVAVVGLEFSALPRDVATSTPTGVRLQMNMDDFLLEDCKITNFGDGITAQLTGGALHGIKIRRNVIANCYAGDGSHAQGIYCDEVVDLLIEENVIDHGGWVENVPGSNPPDIFKHAIYIQGDAQGVTVRGNILSNPSSHGLQMRSGGVANDNLFLRNAVALLMAGDGEARGNVILDGKDIDAGLPRRQALHIQNVDDGVLVSHNIIANSTPVSSSKAISIVPLDEGGGSLHGTSNATIEHNVVFNWGGEALDVRDFASPPVEYQNITIRNNQFQNFVDPQELVQHQSTNTPAETTMSNNRYYSSQTPTPAWMRVGTIDYSLSSYLNLVGDTTSSAMQVPFPDPLATIGTYNASLGGIPTHDAFIAEALLQSKDNWRPHYTARAAIAYFRAGFGLADY